MQEAVQTKTTNTTRASVRILREVTPQMFAMMRMQQIAFCDQILDRARTFKDRTRLKDDLRLERSTLLHIVSQCDFQRIATLGPASQVIVRGLGLRFVQNIRDCDAAIIARKIQQYNKVHNVMARPANLGTVNYWKFQADRTTILIEQTDIETDFL